MKLFITYGNYPCYLKVSDDDGATWTTYALPEGGAGYDNKEPYGLELNELVMVGLYAQPIFP